MNGAWIKTYFSLWRVLPVYFFFKTNKNSQKCKQDLEQWAKHEMTGSDKSVFWKFAFLITNELSCRNILLNRLQNNFIMKIITRILFPPLNSLYIGMPTDRIGGGVSFQHGFSTVVSAKSIGINCRINQQVTVGHKGFDAPIIGDNVRIMVGAIVIGGISLGDNASVAAGAVVVKDVPSNTIVAGVPAKVIKEKN